MSRSNWKGPVFEESSLRKILLSKIFLNWNKKLTKRNISVPFIPSEERFIIYNGNTFKRFLLTKDKVGFKAGFFSNSRKISKKK